LSRDLNINSGIPLISSSLSRESPDATGSRRPIFACALGWGREKMLSAAQLLMTAATFPTFGHADGALKVRRARPGLI